MNRKERRSAEAQNKARPVAPARNPLLMRAIQLSEQRKLAEAVALCQQLLATSPREVEAMMLIAGIELELGRPQEALPLLNQAIAINPRYQHAYLLRGIAQHDSKAYSEAIADYEKLLTLNPTSVDAHNNRAFTLLTLKRFDEAIAGFDCAIAADPRHLGAHINRGEAFDQSGRYTEAVDSYHKGLLINPTSFAAYNNLALSLQSLGRIEDAFAACEQALTLTSTVPEIHNTRASILINLDRLPEAIESAARAIALRPGYPEAHMNSGVAFKHLGQYDTALSFFDKAIALRPELADASWNKSLLHLLLGDYEQGWQLYEWRWKIRAMAKDQKHYPVPLWLGGEPINGKTILLHTEQGLGDTIQFCRYALLVQALGAKVIIDVPPPLRSLATTLSPDIHVLVDGESLSLPDFHCPLMSLPLAFRTTLKTIPAPIPYLYVDPVKQQAWQQKLGLPTKRRVGLVWSGIAANKNDRNRSLSLSALAPLLACDAEFHCLQKELRPNDAERLAEYGITPHMTELNDFTDTAALIAELDLVISVDTSVAHLAGALGKPVWILIAFIPDFRWLLARDDSPWYPTARLFRQPRYGDWEDVMRQVLAVWKE